MTKRKVEAAMKKLQPDVEAVKVEEPSPEEEPTGETGAEKAEELSPEEEPTGESGTEKTEEPSPEEEPTGETGAEKAEEPSPEEKLSGESGAGSQVVYKIVCRNKITKRLGGVDFTEGEGYTTDGFAASWFAAKDGYTVEPAE